MKSRMFTALIAAAVMVCGPAAAQQPTQAQAEQAMAEWDSFALTRAVALKCPAIEPWKIVAYGAAMERRQVFLQGAVNFPQRLNQAADQVDPLACTDPKLAAYIQQLDIAYANAFIDLAGWYPYRTTPCYVEKVEPATVKAEIDRLLARYPELKPLADFWATAPAATRDAQCPNNQWREPGIGRMLSAFSRRDSGDMLTNQYPPEAIFSGLSARRKARAAVKYPADDMAVSSVASDFVQDSPTLIWGWDALGRLVGFIKPTGPGQSGEGVELRLYPNSQAAVQAFKPVKELAPFRSPGQDANIKDVRTWQFGPEAEAAIAGAPGGTYVVMAGDITIGTKRELKEWGTPIRPVRVPARDLRAAKSWAFSAGPIGVSVKP